MDFVVGLPPSVKGNKAVWVVVDRLTKLAHFLPVKMTFSMERYAQIYIEDIVRMHGVPVSIVSDRDTRFTSNYQATIGIAPYEALYGRKCRSPLYWNEVGERKILVPELIRQTVEKIDMIQDQIKMAQDRQKLYADRRRKHIQFDEEEKIFLKVAPIKGVIRFGEKGKLKPRYIGPFEILTRVGDLAYQLALPPSLSSVHNVFHVSMLRKYVHDPSHIVNYKDLTINNDLTYEEAPEAVLERKIHHLRNKDIARSKSD
ncbi:hypothetical protein DH2020_029506 [Rehmannia glutinosa]|uniref:Tf2-1-like SH3-like domain-containing protein n=1 Tax=Rehmannia glutinosa TaxID=99300 RepID=A0ABR0VRZ4_REHGL